MRRQVYFLIDGCNPCKLRLCGSGEIYFLAVKDDGAVISAVSTCQNLDQGGFAGSVLADKPHHFLWLDLKRSGVENGDTGESLINAIHGQEHCRSRVV